MKVLAERSNRIFIVGPIMLVILSILIYFMMKYFIFRNGFHFYGRRRRILFSVFISLVTGWLAFVSAIIERICMPKVLIEYDNAGIYIYKHRRNDPIILRFESIYSFTSEADIGSEGITLGTFSYEQVALSGDKITGTLRIRTADDEIKIRGIHDVKSVERKLDKLRDDYMRLRNERYNAIIEQKRREEELAELAKHDPNT